MQVPYAIQASIYGNGVFATAAIRRGTCVWDFRSATTQLLSEHNAHGMCARIDEDDDLMRSILE
jgi:hypothetical protein